LNIFIIGFGDIGRRVAQLELQTGSGVTALVRTPNQLQGIRFVPGDLDQPETLKGLPTRNSLLYYFAPPMPNGTTDQRMRNWLFGLTPGNLPHKVIYISTTGVYGDHSGAWVDETTPPRPNTARAKRRLDAEQRLNNWSETCNIPVVILRVGGIYSLERLPVEAIRQLRPVLRREEASFSNRIHADDLARVCVAAAHTRHPAGTTIYNASDGRGSTMTDYFHAIADAFGLPRCPEISRAEAEKRLSPAMLSYLNESRRIDNRKMLSELQITLGYPDITHALEEISTPPP